MNSPAVSVIIPNYNHEHFLEQRITSILNQTYLDFEIIILDDCSKDASRDVIEKYRSDPRVSNIVYNEVNSGSTFVQWKKGIGFAKGDWIWIAESDDYADPSFLETMLSSFQGSENIGLIYCDSAIVVNGVVQEETFANKKNKNLLTNHWGRNYTNNGIKEIEDFVLPYGTINNSSAVLCRRDILLKVNPFDVAFKFMGDKYTFIKILSASDVAYVNQPLNFYRAAADSKPKHTQDYFNYFYEQFLIFAWAKRNIHGLSKEALIAKFRENCDVSLISLNKRKVKILFILFRLDQELFFVMISTNLQRMLKRVLK